jgi:serine/threonine protein kinase
VLEIPVAVATDHADSQSDPDFGRDGFWTPSSKKQLLVIATPFRKGLHFAKFPTDFLPIIAHLQKLHKAGYVHGDIRAYNTVFSEQKGGPGFLIDFDFAGKKGKAFYPKGYNPLLPDGYRRGEGGEEIKVWEDWSALGRLIFDVHRIRKPEAEDDDQFWNWFSKCKEYWTTLEEVPPGPMIKQLKDLLEKLDEKQWTIEPWGNFNDFLKKSKTSGLRTKQGATGSPPKGTHQ